MADIIYELMDSLRAHLQSKMVDAVPAELLADLAYTGSDEEEYTLKPQLVKIGRLQDDPTDLAGSTAEPSVHVAIHTGDPADLSDGWKHAIVGTIEGSMTNASFLPGNPREIGGGALWWRRFKVEYRAFFLASDQTEAEAARLGNLLRGLIELYCDGTSRVNEHGWDCTLADSFGEVALKSAVVKSQAFQGGGPDDDYIWDGEVWVQVLTERLV